MRKIVFVFIVLAILGYYFSQNSVGENLNVEKYSNSDAGYSFEYDDSNEGYVLQEFEGDRNAYENLVEGLVLIQQEDYESLMNGERDGGEGPPTINIFVFSNSRNLTPQGWVEAYPNISNIQLVSGDLDEATVSGEPAVMYEADGLYASTNFVVSSGDYLYFLSGSYLDRNSDLYKDFDSIVNSLNIVE